MYVIGLVKSWAVTPLTCSVVPTATLAPVVENVATSAVTSVPNGTVAVTAVLLIVAVTSAPIPTLFVPRNAYAVSAFAAALATVMVTS